jgi:hydroxymethylbilane synthase|tara:strand:- start:1758 stop:2507 length:750 start_codon:yes stop_codon:yes gene_type:complete
MIRVGVRGSKLALAYADKAIKAIGQGTIEVIQTDGDLNPDTPIHEIGGKGVFCNAIEYGLKYGLIDVGVHSLKDMPGDVEHPDLHICAVLERNRPYDVLIGKVFDGFVIGTSSPRRKAQLEQLYSGVNVQIKPIRGNIDTRLAKLDAGEYDAIVLAEAGLDALGIKRDYERLTSMVPAVGQGIIALQTRKDDVITNEIVSKANHKLTYDQAQLERALLKGIGGDCSTRVAGHATGNNPIKLEAVYYTEN